MPEPFGLPSRQRAFCDGRSRRDFMLIGGLGLGGLALPQLLAAEAQASSERSHKAVIMVFLPGGPPHQDMWDLKMDAPSEIRGEFSPIRTTVPGIEICELFPKIASMMHHFVPIRSITGLRDEHSSVQTNTGHFRQGANGMGWPSFGAWVSKTQGAVHPAVPPNLSLFYKTDFPGWADPGDGGFLGLAHGPFRLVGGKSDTSKFDHNLTLQGVTLDRLQERHQLLASFDRFRRDCDSSGAMNGFDTFNSQALGILTNSRIAAALDYTKEDPKTIERYGPPNPQFHDDGAPRMTQNFLIARRLVEAGARVVSLNFSRWDWHSQNFSKAREEFPLLDSAVSALVQDLVDRGMQRDVSVVVWGEFGRTPRINSSAGRDHWPQVSCALLAGGGMKTGQVIGATNRLGESAVDRPVSIQEVLATLYHNLGLNVDKMRETDNRGRPFYPVDSGVQPMRELI